MKRIIFAMLMLTLLMPVTAESGIKEGTFGTVVAQGAAIRGEPTKAVPPLARIGEGERVTVLGLIQNGEDTWLFAEYDAGGASVRGYIMLSFVSCELYDEEGLPIKIPESVRVTAEAVCHGYNHVGSNWTRSLTLNGKELSPSLVITVATGDEMRFGAAFTENDSYPDIGRGEKTVTLTQSDIDKGASFSFDVMVYENKGRYSGYGCKWTVTFYLRRTQS